MDGDRLFPKARDEKNSYPSGGGQIPITATVSFRSKQSIPHHTKCTHISIHSRKSQPYHPGWAELEEVKHFSSAAFFLSRTDGRHSHQRSMHRPAGLLQSREKLAEFPSALRGHGAASACESNFFSDDDAPRQTPLFLGWSHIVMDLHFSFHQHNFDDDVVVPMQCAIPEMEGALRKKAPSCFNDQRRVELFAGRKG